MCDSEKLVVSHLYIKGLYFLSGWVPLLIINSEDIIIKEIITVQPCFQVCSVCHHLLAWAIVQTWHSYLDMKLIKISCSLTFSWVKARPRIREIIMDIDGKEEKVLYRIMLCGGVKQCLQYGEECTHIVCTREAESAPNILWRTLFVRHHSPLSSWVSDQCRKVIAGTWSVAW